MVLDVRMPQMSGLTLQEKLSNPEVQIPIVFITGYGELGLSEVMVKVHRANGMRKRCMPSRWPNLLE
jgi:FixJ family two-component response regulator